MTAEQLHAINELSWRIAYAHGRALDFEEAHAAAWHAIVEAQLTGSGHTERDLYAVARRAIQDEAAARRRHHGRRDDGRVRERFAAFWHDPERHDPADHVSDRQALQQVWARLSAREQDALIALATASTPEEAARLAGVSHQAFKTRVSRARARARALWHEHETPPQHWGRDSGGRTRPIDMARYRRRRRLRRQGGAA